MNPHNLLNLETLEAERIAHAEGLTLEATLFARLADLEAERDALELELSNAKEDSLSDWERKNGPVNEYYQFFHDCFERLAGHYPCPSVTSDYDRNVIFEAIERGESA